MSQKRQAPTTNIDVDRKRIRKAALTVKDRSATKMDQFVVFQDQD